LPARGEFVGITSVASPDSPIPPDDPEKQPVPGGELGETPTRRADFDDYQTRAGLSAGRRMFGRFILESQAGRGGMGVVWRARDERLGRTVALKFLPPEVAADAEAVVDLKRETTRCLELTHPHIVRVYDLEEAEGLAAISMEFIEGESLAKRKVAAPGGCLPASALAPLVAQLCAALDYAHGTAKVVHRDLKPANILVTREGVVKISDSGIARTLSESSTRLTGHGGDTSGTIPYMSPQQVRGRKPAAADDIYALGATLYELLASKPPFFRGDAHVLMRQILEEAPLPPSVQRAELGVEGEPIPPAWEETILACLAKERERRPQTAGEVARRLATVETGSRKGPEKGQGPNGKEEELGSQVQDPGSQVRPGPALDAAPPAEASEVNPEASGEGPGSMPTGGSARRRNPDVRATLGRWLTAAAAIVLLALGLSWYWGAYLPVRRSRAEAGRVAEEERQADERARLAAEQAHREALGWVTNLPLTASDNEIAAVGAKVDAYAAGAPAERVTEVRAALGKQRDLILAERERMHLANARGGLVVTTTPPGAEVAVGGFAVERSPATLKDVKLGKHPVVIRLAGYEEERREAEVRENEFATLDVALIRSTGALQVTSVPPDLEVEVRSQMPGASHQTVRTPATLEKLPTGGYELVFRREGWPDQKRTVTVVRNQTVPGQAEFAGGTLEITSTPSGAEVWMQGRKIGTAPLNATDFVPGPFELEYRLKGYKSAIVRVDVRARQTARAAGMLERISRPVQGQPWTVPDPGLEMRPIPSGTFTMGSEHAYLNEKPLTRVTISQPFWLGKTEVTQGQWEAVMGENPSHFKSPNRPADSVLWNDAVEFCRKLTQRERAAGRLPEGYEYALPTEAQWEYACRAGTTGDDFGDLNAMAWYGNNSGDQTHSVERKQANAWGLYDMLGNVWEWCLDWKGDYPGGSVTDYRGPASGIVRVRRGGSWDYADFACRPSNRDGAGKAGSQGFRLALSPSR
jgi:formylglycine-generating enzyme required for sulfatase activity/serine/threonine protein kinase